MSPSKHIADHQQGWRLYRYGQELDGLSIEQIFAQISVFPTTLKDDKRSLVRLGSINGCKLVAKQPRDKNRRKWSRLLSLVRDGEAKKSAKTLVAFQKLGIPSVKPIAVAEKRSFGFLKESWLIYQYKEGQPVELQQIDLVLAVLKKLHQSGYRHDDPNLENFLIDQSGQIFLIDCKGRPRIGRFSDYYDYLLLADRNPKISDQQVHQWFEFEKGTVAYRLARFYQSYKAVRSKLKKRLRKKK